MTIGVNAIIRAVQTLQIATTTKAQNVYHFQHLSVEDKTDEQVVTAIVAYMEELYDTVKGLMKTDVALAKLECYELILGVWQPFGVGTPTKVGTNETERLPAGVALLVHAFKQRTGFSDKKYLAGMCEDRISGDFWITAAQVAGAAFGVQWIAQYTGPESTVILPVSLNVTTGLVRTYTDTEVGITASYQRRRKPGVGLT